MSDIKNVTVVGGGGNLGTYIVKSLLAVKFTVTILSRPVSQSKFPDGIKVIKTDYTSLPALKEALCGQDAVVCAVGVQGIPDQINLIDAAEAVGVKRFILDEFGNAPDQKRLPELEFAREQKKRILVHAMEKAAENSSFTWTALATGNFIDWAIKKFPAMGFSIPDRTARLYDTGNEPITGTTMAGIGNAVTGILQRPAATANKFLRVRSLQVTQKDILAAFEEATGEKWSVMYVSSKDVLAQGKAKLAAGDKGAILDLVTVQLFEEGAGRSIVVTKEDSNNELLGLPEEEDLLTVIKGILSPVQLGKAEA
ncbi:NAD(P)-binding protein [Wilcoxina mikolae CBS 423.85]|nr:NAD(P)-binding protein [Wilcoxina mikolae CBS 423.85]